MISTKAKFFAIALAAIASTATFAAVSQPAQAHGFRGGFGHHGGFGYRGGFGRYGGFGYRGGYRGIGYGYRGYGFRRWR